MFDNTQIDYSKLIVVSNYKLCVVDFLSRVEQIVGYKPKMFVLREKQMEEDLFDNLAFKCKQICDNAGVDFCINSNIEAAIKYNVQNVHIPLSMMKDVEAELGRFQKVGTSVHNMAEMRAAIEVGVDYVFAGHIFETACKEDLPGRGLEFLHEMCELAKKSRIDVYAIGGIDDMNYKTVLEAGADGYCMMSAMML